VVFSPPGDGATELPPHPPTKKAKASITIAALKFMVSPYGIPVFKWTLARVHRAHRSAFSGAHGAPYGKKRISMVLQPSPDGDLLWTGSSRVLEGLAHHGNIPVLLIIATVY
jgi:hypothetical protein